MTKLDPVMNNSFTNTRPDTSRSLNALLAPTTSGNKSPVHGDAQPSSFDRFLEEQRTAPQPRPERPSNDASNATRELTQRGRDAASPTGVANRSNKASDPERRPSAFDRSHPDRREPVPPGRGDDAGVKRDETPATDATPNVDDTDEPAKVTKSKVDEPDQADDHADADRAVTSAAAQQLAASIIEGGAPAAVVETLITVDPKPVSTASGTAAVDEMAMVVGVNGEGSLNDPDLRASGTQDTSVSAATTQAEVGLNHPFASESPTTGEVDSPESTTGLISEAGGHADQATGEAATTERSMPESPIARAIDDTVTVSLGPDGSSSEAIRSDDLRPEVSRPDDLRPDALRLHAQPLNARVSEGAGSESTAISIGAADTSPETGITDEVVTQRGQTDGSLTESSGPDDGVDTHTEDQAVPIVRPENSQADDRHADGGEAGNNGAAFANSDLMVIDGAPTIEPRPTVQPNLSPDGARVDGATGVQQLRATEATTNAVPVGAPPVAGFDGEVWEQVQRAVNLVRQNGPGRHEVSLVLRPDDLGSVSIELVQRGDEVAVRIVTQTAAAQDRLDRGRLLAELQSAGIDSSSVDISHHDPGRSDGGASDGEPGSDRQRAGSSSDGSSNQVTGPVRRSAGRAGSSGGSLDLAL